jgi:hypothetical protein
MDRMIRTHRSVYALAFAIFFALGGLSSAFGLHRCPQHDVLPVPTAGHIQEHPSGTADTDADSKHDHGGPCTCVGDFDDGESYSHELRLTEIFEATPIDHVVKRSGRSVILTPIQFYIPFSKAPPHVV